MPHKALCLLIALLVLVCPFSYARHSPGASKPVHVRDYTKKDGTRVRAHGRNVPGTTPAHERTARPHTPPPFTGSITASHPRTSYRRDYMAEGFTAHPSVQRDKHGRIKRSGAAKDAFKRGHPCPANGNTSGSCPGYVIDHVNPLECGGADAPFNMQWQTVAEGKAKDKTEGFCR